jgi:hypothetical protein
VLSSGNVKNDMRHAAATHQRWVQLANRRQGDPDYLSAWYAEQCGACRFWGPLSGALGLDYGGCTNQASPYEGTVRFEHDGCDVFEASGESALPDS